MNDNILINEAKANEMMKAIADPVAKHLVMFGIATARTRALGVGLRNAKGGTLRPECAFDMAFFVSVIHSMFSNREIIDGILSGQDLAQASGWDV